MDKKTLYGFAKAITPPFIFSIFRESGAYTLARSLTSKVVRDEYTPAWHRIMSGPLKGREVYVDPKGDWQREMLSGSYDDFFFEYVERFDLKDKTVFDIGTHVGFHSMYFAELVGESGKVHAFEPNPYNIERIRLILDRNTDLKTRINLHEMAVSDKIGTEDFIFSKNIENGTSSGSFLETSHTHNDKSGYEKEGGFKRISVKTVSLDKLSVSGIRDTPYLIKMDIEGAEYLALAGGKELIKKHLPIILLEVHSIFNMLKVAEFFTEIGYEIELLKEEPDGRCYISALPKK